MNSSGRTGARAAHGHRAGACSFSLVRDTKQYDSEESSSGRLFFYAFFGEEDQRRQEVYGLKTKIYKVSDSDYQILCENLHEFGYENLGELQELLIIRFDI